MARMKEMIADMVDASAGALGLAIDPAWRDDVIVQLSILLVNADLVSAFELPDEAEPAPVFEVPGDDR